MIRFCMKGLFIKFIDRHGEGGVSSCSKFVNEGGAGREVKNPPNSVNVIDKWRLIYYYSIIV